MSSAFVQGLGLALGAAVAFIVVALISKAIGSPLLGASVGAPQ